MISIPDIPQKLIQNQRVSSWEVPCLRQILSDLACGSTDATKVFEIAEGIFSVNDGSPPECNQSVPGPGLDGGWQS